MVVQIDNRKTQRITAKEVYRSDGTAIGVVQVDRAGNPLMDSGKVLFGSFLEARDDTKGLKKALEQLELDKGMLRVGTPEEVAKLDGLKADLDQMVTNMDGGVWNNIQTIMTKINRGKKWNNVGDLVNEANRGKNIEGLGIEELAYFNKLKNFESLRMVVRDYDELDKMEDEYRDEIKDLKEQIAKTIKDKEVKNSQSKEITWKNIKMSELDHQDEIGNLEENLSQKKFYFEIDKNLYENLRSGVTPQESRHARFSDIDVATIYDADQKKQNLGQRQKSDVKISIKEFDKFAPIVEKSVRREVPRERLPSKLEKQAQEKAVGISGKRASTPSLTKNSEVSHQIIAKGASATLDNLMSGLNQISTQLKVSNSQSSIKSTQDNNKTQVELVNNRPVVGQHTKRISIADLKRGNRQNSENRVQD
jgi:hypothetical protein